MTVYKTTLRGGIRPTPEFTKKGLAQFAVNTGTKCGHDCLYCSTGSLVRMHRSFRTAGESPFGFGYAIVDPDTPERVARDARQLRSRGLVQLCTIVDAWAPEAQKHQLGRHCLEAILSQPGWAVRALTKNAAVEEDYGLMEKHRDRVLLSLSLTGTARQERQLAVIERHASPVSERIAALQEAHRRGLRTYGMLCPLLPGIADDRGTVRELLELCCRCGAEEIFVEPVNARGSGLRLMEEALREAGFDDEATAVGLVRNRRAWSAYCTNLLRTVQQEMGHLGILDKLRFLLYPTNLQPTDLASVRRDDRGVRWLGK
jgi:DNA repair photolyase